VGLWRAPFELVVTTSCYFVGFAFEGLMQAKMGKILESLHSKITWSPTYINIFNITIQSNWAKHHSNHHVFPI
jgi:hypothetical protein